ncbi:hypothetical protein ACJX0J_019555, partial [Zea mays]
MNLGEEASWTILCCNIWDIMWKLSMGTRDAFSMLTVIFLSGTDCFHIILICFFLSKMVMFITHKEKQRQVGWFSSHYSAGTFDGQYQTKSKFSGRKKCYVELPTGFIHV